MKHEVQREKKQADKRFQPAGEDLQADFHLGLSDLTGSHVIVGVQQHDKQT